MAKRVRKIDTRGSLAQQKSPAAEKFLKKQNTRAHRREARSMESNLSLAEDSPKGRRDTKSDDWLT
jgi:hypothetical protein